ncbi:hypothetical protein DXG01_003678 [Tephrocybe rancida]|nr:hypothetical protein DXG01_003678 [Tephrocybe rancida]
MRVASSMEITKNTTTTTHPTPKSEIAGKPWRLLAGDAGKEMAMEARARARRRGGDAAGTRPRPQRSLSASPPEAPETKPALPTKTGRAPPPRLRGGVEEEMLPKLGGEATDSYKGGGVLGRVFESWAERTHVEHNSKKTNTKKLHGRRLKPNLKNSMLTKTPQDLQCAIHTCLNPRQAIHSYFGVKTNALIGISNSLLTNALSLPCASQVPALAPSVLKARGTLATSRGADEKTG